MRIGAGRDFTIRVGIDTYPSNPLLLNQQIVVGIGNIYASEILFRAGISPKRLAKNISLNMANEIYRQTQHVLFTAIEAGGST